MDNLKGYIGARVRVTTEHGRFYSPVFHVDEKEELFLVVGTWVHADKCEPVPIIGPDEANDLLRALEKIADYSAGSTIQPALIAREAIKNFIK